MNKEEKYTINSCPSFKQARTKYENLIKHDYQNAAKSKLVLDFIKNKKIYLKIYGCQVNYRDSEIVASLFLDAGGKITDKESEADVIFINSCSVREKAKNKIFHYISSIKNKIIILSGCVIMEEGIIEEIIKNNINVNIVISMNNISKIFFILEQYLLTHKKIIDIDSNFFYIDESVPNKFRASNFKAFVNINYGCNKLCTYCIVPYTRGPERCRTFNDILDECKYLKLLNYKEIVLLGQNVNSYYDKANKKTFSQLLEAVALLGIPRISFLTCHPYDFSLDIVYMIKKYNNILPYIHLPIQSGDDEILKKMGRKYNSQVYINLINEIKNIMPEIALSTDIIIGFPGESNEAFENTLKIIKEIEFDNIFMFIFSKRKGTPASKMEDKTSEEEKKNRLCRLNEMYISIVEKNNKKYINKIYDVLVDGVSKKNKLFLEGRLITNRIVHFKGAKKLIGQIIKIKITESHPFFLKGEIVKC